MHSDREDDSWENLPARPTDLAGVTLYHVLGKVSPSPELVDWDSGVCLSGDS